ncbi:MAG: 4Fe-4S dicluster domain-containing protein [Desulfohalobiaceae bacterium]|nr:4Fe-4S dicluster domain-containing protein [Desulfohalobiaceae bacterium]
MKTSIYIDRKYMSWNRRTFLKFTGLGSISLTAACSEPEKTLYSLSRTQEDMVTGEATRYASTCRECPAGCGLIAKHRDGRVIKLEGNPFHPISRGTLCMRGQAALQAVYNPDRLRLPRIRGKDGWRDISYKEARSILKDKAEAAAAKGSNRVTLVSEIMGEPMRNLMTSVLDNWNSSPPLIYEPFAYEALKLANKAVFGLDGLVSYRLDEADVLLSFGAEFLETWLSPIEYARKFKAMHAIDNHSKGIFVQAGPYRSLTGVNADHWLACRPGGEAAVALGLIQKALEAGRGSGLSPRVLETLEDVTAGMDSKQVRQLSGLAPSRFEQLSHRLLEAGKPLILGGATLESGQSGFKINLAANLLGLVLDPKSSLIDARNRHRVEKANRTDDIRTALLGLPEGGTDLLILNNVNPAFNLPGRARVREALSRSPAFKVCLGNFLDETAELADMILPVSLPLETWDEYAGKQGMTSILQPAMGGLTRAPSLGDLLLGLGFTDKKPAKDYQEYLTRHLSNGQRITTRKQWVEMVSRGGIFAPAAKPVSPSENMDRALVRQTFSFIHKSEPSELIFTAVSSIRFFDGRQANRPWLNEIPDPLSKVAWQTPLQMHPDTAETFGMQDEDLVRVHTGAGTLEAPVSRSSLITPGMLLMQLGQGHSALGRYARNQGLDPYVLLPADLDETTGGPGARTRVSRVEKTGKSLRLAKPAGSKTQHDRTFALTVELSAVKAGAFRKRHGLGMHEFPLALPLPEGYDPQHDFYPAHEHDSYRWVMVVDLDRCIGCAACTAACYAENNLGVVGEEQMIQGREMAWLWVERYFDEQDPTKVLFLPMPCQHCDNAPCEPVCPVYAPHHSKEGLNNQIYNRCIGTRFCSQNCPYKVRRFNYFDWEWPEPLNLQLNPDVTVRSKGVMEKCSFCIQRIKKAHTMAKNEKRSIQDQEVIPACVQTCPTQALAFGNLMDPKSRVSLLVKDPRAYQLMGYLNTKPGVIYLKKVVQAI